MVQIYFITVVTLVAGIFANPMKPTSYIKTRVPQLNAKIVGGSETSIDRHPYQISLEYYHTHTCGGSLVTTRHVVTAGHCVAGKEEFNYRIRAGSSIRGSGGVVVNVESFIISYCFNYFTFDCDLAVVTLVSDVSLGSTIALIPLPELNYPVVEGTISTVTGWGSIEEGGGSVDVLRMVQVPVYNHAQCNVDYVNDTITEYMICAGEEGKDSCQGDSGGPMVIDGLLVGVVSWGRGCGRLNFPGVYSSVPAQRTFIKDQTGI